MDTGGAANKQETIKEQTEGLLELLGVLVHNIDNLVERSTQPQKPDTGTQDIADNIFDEILSTLRNCKHLTKEATEKVQDGISRKVH